MKDERQSGSAADAVRPEAPRNIPVGDGNAFDLSNLLLLGDADIITMLTKMFETTVTESLENLKSSVENMEWDKVMFIAHKLKSSLGVIQIHSIMDNMNVIESSAKKRENLGAILPLVNASIEDYYLCIPSIKAAIAGKG